MHPQEEQIIHPYNLEQATKRFQRGHIRNVLEAMNWDKAAAAIALGIKLNELEQKLKL